MKRDSLDLDYEFIIEQAGAGGSFPKRQRTGDPSSIDVMGQIEGMKEPDLEMLQDILCVYPDAASCRSPYCILHTTPSNYDDVLESHMKSELFPLQVEKKEKKEKKEVKNEPKKFIIASLKQTKLLYPELAEEEERKNRCSKSTKNCVRYTVIEEKALVHAKMRLQISGMVGEGRDDQMLVQYYEHYLRVLAPQTFTRYVKRDVSALTRKFKAIKAKTPKLVPYIDPALGSFWKDLVDLVSHKPLLHPIFYTANSTLPQNSLRSKTRDD